MSEPVHVSSLQVVGGSSGISGDMSADITSLAVNIDEIVTYAVQATFTGSPVGSITLEGSNNPTILGYDTIDLSTAAVNGAGSYLVNVELPGYSYVRLAYTFTSGSGTMNAIINTKRR